VDDRTVMIKLINMVMKLVGYVGYPPHYPGY